MAFLADSRTDKPKGSSKKKDSMTHEEQLDYMLTFWASSRRYILKAYSHVRSMLLSSGSVAAGFKALPSTEVVEFIGGPDKLIELGQAYEAYWKLVGQYCRERVQMWDAAEGSAVPAAISERQKLEKALFEAVRTQNKEEQNRLTELIVRLEE